VLRNLTRKNATNSGNIALLNLFIIIITRLGENATTWSRVKENTQPDISIHFTSHKYINIEVKDISPPIFRKSSKEQKVKSSKF